MHKPTLLSRMAWGLTVPGALVAGSALAGVNGPLQTQRCNEPPPALASVNEFDPLADGQVTGLWLKPGTTRTTAGTNSRESPELAGTRLYSSSQLFEFKDPKGQLISGKYSELIVAGTDKKCKCHLRIQVREGCVTQVVINKYIHPLKLVADYRDDLSGKIPSRSASRSKDGTTVTFDLTSPVCAGQDTRWLLLNTSIEEVAPLDVLQFVTPEGQFSPPLPVHVPLIQ